MGECSWGGVREETFWGEERKATESELPKPATCALKTVTRRSSSETAQIDRKTAALASVDGGDSNHRQQQLSRGSQVCKKTHTHHGRQGGREGGSEEGR